MLLDLIQPLGSSSISSVWHKKPALEWKSDLYQLARVSIGNPLGQVLHIVSGVGRVQSAGEAARTVKPVDEKTQKPFGRSMFLTKITTPGTLATNGATSGSFPAAIPQSNLKRCQAPIVRGVELGRQSFSSRRWRRFRRSRRSHETASVRRNRSRSPEARPATVL
jgi:hypothetical protein